MKKKRKWVEGLTWSESELRNIIRGGGSEAYDWTYGEYPIPKVYREGAKKDLKKYYGRKKMRSVS